MPDAPAAAPMVPNGPPPNAVDPRSSQRPAWAENQDKAVSAAKERLGLSGNSNFLDRVMAKTSPDAEPKKDAPLDTRGTKVLGKDQVNPPAKKVEIKENAPPEKASSAEAIESLLNGEIEAADLAKEKGKEEVKSKDEPKDDELEPKAKDPAQQDKGDEKKAYKWGELRSKADKLDELEPKYRELEEKLKQVETASKVKDFEELQKKYEETSSKLAAFNVQESPEFREHVIQPIDERYGLLEGLAKEYKLDMEGIEKALALPEKVARNRAMAKILAESEEPIDSVSQADAARAASEIFELRQYGTELQKNAKAALEAMKLEREKVDGEKSVKQQKEFADTAKITWDRLTKAVPFLKENPAEAKAIFEALKPEEMGKAPPAIQAYNAYAGQILTRLLPQHKQAIAAKDGRIAELESRIAELTNGGPSINGDQPRSEQNGHQNPLMRPQGVSMADWILAKSNGR